MGDTKMSWKLAFLIKIMYWLVTFSLVAKILWDAVIQLSWKFNGVRDQLNVITESKNEVEKCAQVLKVWTFLPFRHFHYPRDFFLTHEKFEDPEKLIYLRNVHLLSVDQTWANFVEVSDPEAVLNPKKYPFMQVGLPLESRRLIKIPVEKFHQLVKTIDVSDRKVVWLFHTWRCGSTVFSQIFNSLPGWSTISESPCVFTAMDENCPDKRELSKFAKGPHYEMLVDAIIKITISKTPKGNSVFWKATVADTLMLPVLFRLYPNHINLFGYRDVLPSAKSLAKLCDFAPLAKQPDIHRFFDPRYMLPPPYAPVEDIIRSESNNLVWFSVEVFNWAVSMRLISEARQNGITVKPIRYENFMSDKEGTILKLLNYLGIDTAYLSYALKATEEDSQGASDYSQEKRMVNPDWVRTKEEVDMCNRVLEQLDLPDLDSSHVVPDTL